MVIAFKEHFQINFISILKNTAALMNFFQDFQIYLSLCISFMLTEYDEKTPLKPSTSYKCFFPKFIHDKVYRILQNCFEK